MNAYDKSMFASWSASASRSGREAGTYTALVLQGGGELGAYQAGVY